MASSDNNGVVSGWLWIHSCSSSFLVPPSLARRASIVVDRDNVVRIAEYVKEFVDHPNCDAALSVAKELA